MKQTKTPTKTKVKNFQKKLYQLLEAEVQARIDMRGLYDQFMVDVKDDRIARRHVLHAYFQVQKFRLSKILAQRLEFHPFFGHNRMIDADFGDSFEVEDDNDLI